MRTRLQVHSSKNGSRYISSVITQSNIFYTMRSRLWMLMGWTSYDFMLANCRMQVSEWPHHSHQSLSSVTNLKHISAMHRLSYGIYIYIYMCVCVCVYYIILLYLDWVQGRAISPRFSKIVWNKKPCLTNIKNTLEAANKIVQHS